MKQEGQGGGWGRVRPAGEERRQGSPPCRPVGPNKEAITGIDYTTLPCVSLSAVVGFC